MLEDSDTYVFIVVINIHMSNQYLGFMMKPNHLRKAPPRIIYCDMWVLLIIPVKWLFDIWLNSPSNGNITSSRGSTGGCQWARHSPVVPGLTICTCFVLSSQESEVRQKNWGGEFMATGLLFPSWKGWAQAIRLQVGLWSGLPRLLLAGILSAGSRGKSQLFSGRTVA